jgi:hypothetical protein
MSGAASCFENVELVSGAIEPGHRSVNYIAKELGYDVSTKSAGCEDFCGSCEDGDKSRRLRLSGAPHWVHVSSFEEMEQCREVGCIDPNNKTITTTSSLLSPTTTVMEIVVEGCKGSSPQASCIVCCG